MRIHMFLCALGIHNPGTWVKPVRRETWIAYCAVCGRKLERKVDTRKNTG